MQIISYAALLLLNPVVLILSATAIFFVCKNQQYKKGAYYNVTKNTYSSVRRDKGKYAEYLIYKSLRRFEDTGGKFLFNILIPTANGKTTEIDVLLVCTKGLFVFESKNFSGWIFGNEAHKSWTQTLPKGRGRSHKEHFYNPIMQNASHIRHLKNLVGQNVPMHSIIVFSDRCTLKNITLNSADVHVINHSKVTSVVTEVCSQIRVSMYTEAGIQNIYNKLYPYTQLGYEIKERHVESINRIRNDNSHHQ